MNSYDRSFDDLLAETLLAYQNAFPGVDSSKGSMLFMSAVKTAAARWGLHKQIGWTYDQADPISANRQSLERWALRKGLALNPDESDTELLARVLDKERNAPAGGNTHDYIRWAKEVTGIADAKLYENDLAQGLGTVDVIVWGPTGAGFVIDTPKLTEVYNYIMARRPVGHYLLRVLPISPAPYNVTLTGVGPLLADRVKSDIESFMNSLVEGQALYRDQLTAIAVGNGVLPPPVIVEPVLDIEPDHVTHEIIRPGVISVS
jgi:hypothetical protein